MPGIPLVTFEDTVPINEVYGPTIQGEGPDTGRLCVFVRTHNCPVQCKGCDTHYTWDGSEDGKGHDAGQLIAKVAGCKDRHKHMGVVVSGGEPLLYFRKQEWSDTVSAWSREAWCSLETSGFVSPRILSREDVRRLQHHLGCYSRVCWSPKVTPCLWGGSWSRDQLLANADVLLDTFRLAPHRLYIKMVALGHDDLMAIKHFADTYQLEERGHTVYVMPYGVHAEDVAETSRRLAEELPSLGTGYRLATRLHSTLWGKDRKR